MYKELIHIKEARFGYADKEVLRVQEAVQLPSQLSVLIGRNGSGKSTLLRSILGMIPLQSGSLKLGGDFLENLSPRTRALRISAVLSGNYIPPSGMKVREMIALGRSPHTGWWGSLSKVDEDYIHHSANRVGISELMDKPMGGISDGERQKVLIARALAQDTELILLDEPMAFLDYPARRELVLLLQTLCSEGKSILYSSHDLSISLPGADQIWLIDEQNKLSVQSPKHLKESGLLKKLFGFDLDPPLSL